MLRLGNTITFESGEYIESLGRGVHEMHMSPDGVLYLSEQPDFTTIALEGECLGMSELVVSHYRKTDGNFGIILEGASGNGKTQTIKHICNSLGLPVILINIPFKGTEIKQVLNSVKCDCILVFDEFEKVYSKPEYSESLLGLFDGIDTNHRVLSIISANERRSVSTYFFGRPGRFLFNFKFVTLSPSNAIAFIKKRLEVSNEERMLSYLESINNLSYDICDKIISLIQLHGEEVFITNSKHFNVQPVSISYEFEIVHLDKVKLLCKADYPSHIFYEREDDEYLELNHKAIKRIEKSKIGDIVVVTGTDFKTPNDEYKFLVKKVRKFESFVSDSFGY